eukprot:SAG31_NODE_7200_length_1758_cov_32.971670_1_plen_110_part_00
MEQCGIDTSKFKAHILRSASMRAAVDATGQLDTVLETACVSRKVFSIFYDLPVAVPSGNVDSTTSAEASTASAMVSAMVPPLILVGQNGFASLDLQTLLWALSVISILC